MALTRNVGLRQKILVVPMALLVLGTVALGLFLSLAVAALARENDRARLEGMGAALANLWDDLGRTSALALEMTLSQEELYEAYRAAETGDSGTLEPLLRRVARQARADAAKIVDGKGRTVATSEASPTRDAGEYGALAASTLDAGQLPDHQDSLRAAIRSVVAARGPLAELATVGPLLDPERRVVAAVVLVRRIDQSFLRQEGKRLGGGIEVSIAGDRGVLATTLRGLTLPAPLAPGRRDFGSTVGGRQYRHLFLPIPASTLYLGVSLDKSESAASRRRVELAAISGAALSVLIVAAVLIGAVNAVTAPLGKVVANLKDIGAGAADLTRTLDVRSRDEIGELADSFNGFIARLAGLVRSVVRVAAELLGAAERVEASSRQVGEGVGRQARLLGESVAALQSIEEAVGGIARSSSDLVDTAGQSSAATQQLGATNVAIAGQVEGLFVHVDEVSTSIAQMSTVSQQITASMESLAASAEETASAVTQLDASVADIEANAEMTSQLSEEVARDAERGKEAVNASIQGVTALKELSDRGSRVIEELGNRATAIGKILSVIDEVADQTSLLALNAAIIAAQAGEHGKGFAVVASEIGELAERTAASTQEISSIIDHLQQGAREAVTAMAAGRERAELEVGRAREAGGALEKIRESAFKSLEQARGIALATQEQARGSRQITQAVDRIASMLGDVVSATAQHNGGTQQLARSAQHMREIASLVKDQVREQAAGSQQIGALMEHVRQMAEQISVATSRQANRSSDALEALSSLRAIADGTAARTAELDQVVELLGRQTAALREEVGAFKA